MKKVLTIKTHSEDETIELARKLTCKLQKRGLIALIGELGSGKTVFAKGVAKAVNYKDYSYVNSPSFVVMKEYSGDCKLYHYDVYRLEAESFHDTLDYERYFYGDGITVVEWANKIEAYLPEEYIEVKIGYVDKTERSFSIKAYGDKNKKLVKEFSKDYENFSI